MGPKHFRAFSYICNFPCFFLNCKSRYGHHFSKVHKKYRLSVKITALLLIFRSANIRAVNGLGMTQQKPLSHPTPYDGQLLLLLETFHNKQLCSQGDICRVLVINNWILFSLSSESKKWFIVNDFQLLTLFPPCFVTWYSASWGLELSFHPLKNYVLKVKI